MTNTTESSLIDQALKKFPKARRTPVENFSMGYDSMTMEARMNLEMDRAAYNWHPHVVAAITWVINQKALLAKGR
jgi:hypothetical protein